MQAAAVAEEASEYRNCGTLARSGRGRDYSEEHSGRLRNFPLFYAVGERYDPAYMKPCLGGGI